jgi:restriction endonuclease S subunit
MTQMMAKYQPYPEYKPTGIDWLCDIPERWETKRLKYVFKVENGATPKSEKEEYWDGEIPWVTPDDLGRLNSLYIQDTARKITKKGYQSCGTTLVPEGCIILSTRAPIGHMGVAVSGLCTNQGCRALVFKNHEIAKNYYYYIFGAVKNELQSLGQGSTFSELSKTKLESVVIPMPTSGDATAIADFLDRETVKIDEVVAKKQKLIDLLKEKRQALITHAVTKGLDPNAKLKPSGIEWLGDIPEEWEIKRLNYLMRNIVEKALITDENEFIVALENIESWTGEFVAPENQKIPEGDLKAFDERDVLFGKLRPYLAKALVANQRGLCVGEALVFRTNRHLFNRFLIYRILTREFIDFIDASTQGAKMPRAEWEFIKTLAIAYPQREEQLRIVDFLDRETARIDEVVAKVESQVEKLQEYRQALITSAVTGKIKVSGG